MSSWSMATAAGGLCCAASSAGAPNTTATAIAATLRHSLVLVFMSLLSLNFPLSAFGELREGINGGFDPGAPPHCRPETGRCPFTSGATVHSALPALGPRPRCWLRLDRLRFFHRRMAAAAA